MSHRPFRIRTVMPSVGCCALLMAAWAAPSRAQWAVVDAGAIAQLVQQVETLEQQLQTARDQLTQSKEALSTTTGNRGMSRLLSGTVRNYLPSSSAELSSVEQGVGGLSGLAADVRAAVGVNAVLSPAQLAALSTTDQQRVASARKTAGLQQALAQAALSNVSGRFAAIQSLVDSIAGAGDQKAILELQARISAELGMLQNEQTKLQVLTQSTQAQSAVESQREREYAIVAAGHFASRFQPLPPASSVTR